MDKRNIKTAVFKCKYKGQVVTVTKPHRNSLGPLFKGEQVIFIYKKMN